MADNTETSETTEPSVTPTTPHVSPWGNKDDAKSVPIFAPAYVNQAITEENAEALYEGSVKVGSGTGATVGVYATTPTEMADSTGIAHTGWAKVTTGTGGRAGRVQTEVLVAMSNMESASAPEEPDPSEPSKDTDPPAEPGN